jgi:hypothetical protein
VAPSIQRCENPTLPSLTRDKPSYTTLQQRPERPRRLCDDRGRGPGSSRSRRRLRTGSLAVRLAELGFSVTGVDPARASLDVARAKPNAELVTWVHGDATSLLGLEAAADLAVMTGNMAQVFVSDEDWYATARYPDMSTSRRLVRLRDPTIRGPRLGDLGPRAVPGCPARRPYGRRVMHRDRGRAPPRDL